MKAQPLIVKAPDCVGGWKGVATHTAEYQGYTYKGLAGGRFLGDNLHFSEVSSVGSMGHFVDLDQENASVWSPSPEAYFEKHRPPLVSRRQT